SGRNHVLRARAAIGLEEEVRRGIRVPFGEGVAGTIAPSQKPLMLEEVDYGRVVSPWIRAKGIKSLAGVPIQTEGRLLGVLHVGSLRRRRFEDDAMNLLHLAGG